MMIVAIGRGLPGLYLPGLGLVLFVGLSPTSIVLLQYILDDWSCFVQWRAAA